MKLLNIIAFLATAVWRGIHPSRWRDRWDELHARHEAEVRKGIWQLKIQGRIFEDKDGFLWIKKDDE